MYDRSSTTPVYTKILSLYVVIVRSFMHACVRIRCLQTVMYPGYTKVPASTIVLISYEPLVFFCSPFLLYLVLLITLLYFWTSSSTFELPPLLLILPPLLLMLPPLFLLLASASRQDQRIASLSQPNMGQLCVNYDDSVPARQGCLEK